MFTNDDFDEVENLNNNSKVKFNDNDLTTNKQIENKEIPA